MITDVDYYDSNNELFNLFKKCVEEKGISITIIAISENSNLSLADKICHFKGCNYFSITKNSELEIENNKLKKEITQLEIEKRNGDNKALLAKIDELKSH